MRISGTAPDGAYAGAIADALDTHEELLRGGLGSLTPATEGKFQAANAALWSGGMLVHAPARAVFEASRSSPSSTCPSGDTAVFPRCSSSQASRPK